MNARMRHGAEHRLQRTRGAPQIVRRIIPEIREHATDQNFHSLPPEMGIGDLDAGYAVQRAFVNGLLEHHGIIL